jgi:class 3 adenylate cyclase
MSPDDAEGRKATSPDLSDIEQHLEKMSQMETLLQEKFTKILTVMFTDLKGSTSLAEDIGDLATRMLIKHHNDIVFPTIQHPNGVLVKTIGDGTLSYFEHAQDGLRAAVQIQKEIDEFNMTKKAKAPIMIRIGLHTGKCILEKNDIFGDVVNTASRFESSANPCEICFSEETYNALIDKAEVYCRFVKTTTLKGKKEPVNVYKAFWNPKEVELDLTDSAPAQGQEKVGMSPVMKILLVLIPILILLFVFFKGTGTNRESAEETRTKQHTITIPTEPSK